MKQPSRRPQGYAYVEVIIAALVVMVAVVPAAEALRSVAAGSVLQRELVAQKYAAMATMETVLAEPFSVLQAEADATKGLAGSKYSQSLGAPNRQVVMVAPYDVDNADKDGNPLTGTDDGVVWVGVNIASLGIAFQAIVTEAL